MIFPPLLYAETHYSFRGIYSRLKKREPEIVADVPYRLDPHCDLPLLILVKDADEFPLRLEGIEVEITAPGADPQRHSLRPDTRVINERWWFQVYHIHLNSGTSGPCAVSVRIDYQTDGRTRSCLNDNYRIPRAAPFRTYISEWPLPSLPGWCFGDMHYHSSFTEDQVEFGAPLGATVEMARGMGLRFFAVTDHSYDLDDCIDDPLHNDPALPKWHLLQKQVAVLNRACSDFVVLPGEELSCGNSRGRNIHLLLIDEPTFFEGSGDSAEKWLHTKAQLSLAQVLPELSRRALAYAAHPEIRTPLLQWLLIRRGRWRTRDYQLPGLTGIQILNGREDAGFEAAYTRWRRLLLSGHKLFIIAGNDGHGNFNKFRQIGIPFLTLREHTHQIFGGARTGVKLRGKVSIENIKRSLSDGLNVVTTGPMLELSAGGAVAETEVSIHGDDVALTLRAASSPEFGKFREVSLWLGKIGERVERLLWRSRHFKNSFSFEERIPLAAIEGDAYVRGELLSAEGEEMRRCLTNPIWLTRP